MKLTNRKEFSEKPFDVVAIIKAKSKEYAGDELRFVAYNAIESALKDVNCNYVLNIEDTMSYIDFSDRQGGDAKTYVAIAKFAYDDVDTWADSNRKIIEKAIEVINQSSEFGISDAEIMIQADNSPKPNDFWNNNPY